MDFLFKFRLKINKEILDKNMLAQIKPRQQQRVLFSVQRLPETISTLFEKIGHEQSTLYKLLSKELILPEDNNANSLRIFLTEVRNRLRLFMLTFDEVSVQLTFLSRDHIPPIHNNTLQKAPLLSSPVTITEILSTTKLLSELFTLLQTHLQNTDSQAFFKELILKSLIFYKQTNVVLNGYLRIYKVNGDNR
jgi:hypothetical protein